VASTFNRPGCSATGNSLIAADNTLASAFALPIVLISAVLQLWLTRLRSVGANIRLFLIPKRRVTLAKD
jgi:hypothetical protein